MDYEKKYKEAIKRAYKLTKQNPFDTISQMMEHVFPELKESEDERIRKEITEFILWALDRGSITECQREKSNSWIAWLEKQGEQQPAWSEEDEKEVAVLEAYIRSEDWSDRHVDRALGIVDELVKKLKSLKERCTWKPSEYEVSLLEETARNIRNNVRPFCSEVSALEYLIENIKKL